MSVDITQLAAAERWKVVFQDTGAWRAGIYRPEFNDHASIGILEKHTCPELFICMEGEMGILISDGSKENVATMRPGEAILVTDYHNGFALSSSGYFVVIERDRFSTEYIDRASGRMIKRVTV
jgi:hypothetical protein